MKLSYPIASYLYDPGSAAVLMDIFEAFILASIQGEPAQSTVVDHATNRVEVVYALMQTIIQAKQRDPESADKCRATKVMVDVRMAGLLEKIAQHAPATPAPALPPAHFSTDDDAIPDNVAEIDRRIDDLLSLQFSISADVRTWRQQRVFELVQHRRKLAQQRPDSPSPLHRARIAMEAITALVSVGVPRPTASEVISAIRLGLVPHVCINF